MTPHLLWNIWTSALGPFEPRTIPQNVRGLTKICTNAINYLGSYFKNREKTRIKKMTRTTKGVLFLGVLTLFFGLFGQVASAQGNVAVLVGGNAGFGNFKMTGDKFDLEQMKRDTALSPSFEIRFNQDGKVAVGVEYSMATNLTRVPEHVKVLTEPSTGKELAGYTLSGGASVKTVIFNIYFSTSKGKVRPFIGVGGGINMIEVQNKYQTFVDPSVDDFQFDLPATGSKSSTDPAWAVRAGINFFPHKNLVISLAGGYMNGPLIPIRVGGTF